MQPQTGREGGDVSGLTRENKRRVDPSLKGVDSRRSEVKRTFLLICFFPFRGKFAISRNNNYGMR